mmetsp:Transcript_4918/g.31457  ORF Transcript_4918/g.31457 Transcript_4918/m.31457 type:complete len:233 (-) Transcript_4918:4616-5314(-)
MQCIPSRQGRRLVPLDCFSFPPPSHALYGPCDPTHPFTQRICRHEASYGSIHSFDEPGSIAERLVCVLFFTLSIGCGRRFFRHVRRRSFSFHHLGLGFVAETIQSFQRVLVRASPFVHDVVLCIPNPCNQSQVMWTPKPDQSHLACIERLPDPIVSHEGREKQTPIQLDTPRPSLQCHPVDGVEFPVILGPCMGSLPPSVGVTRGGSLLRCSSRWLCICGSLAFLLGSRSSS